MGYERTGPYQASRYERATFRDSATHYSVSGTKVARQAKVAGSATRRADGTSSLSSRTLHRVPVLMLTRMLQTHVSESGPAARWPWNAWNTHSVFCAVSKLLRHLVSHPHKAHGPDCPVATRRALLNVMIHQRPGHDTCMNHANANHNT